MTKKLLQKTVCDRNSFDTEIINNRSCVKTKRVYDRKNIVFCNSLSKNVVDEKGCLKNLFRKSHSPKMSRIISWMMEVWFVKVSLYEVFLIQKNSANKICEV